ncbi:MAG: hypothetical protein Q7O66_10455 [Dehalococcoidia bacterium]|nr:hypothetical protein [Dehalococcoidia bacterium]
MPDNTRSRLIPGFVLVLVGLFLILIQFLQSAAGFAIMAVGVAFLAGYYLSKRQLGFLIPGLILIGFGAFVGLQQAGPIPFGFESLFFVFLGVPFLLVYAIHTRREGSWGARNWPLFPGLILCGLALLLLLIANQFILNSDQWATVLLWWPILLVGIGIFLILRRK